MPLETDVLVVGLGPVGQAVTALLTQEGVRVLAVDAAPGPHAEPRAAALDDGALRVLRAAGVELPLLEDPEVVLVGVGGREIPIAGDGLALFHQPDLERALLARTGGAARFGSRFDGLVRDERGVTATLSDGVVRAGWLLGCDGARSAVRTACGIPFRGRSAARRWLVLDAEVPAPLDPRPRVRFDGDPRRPAAVSLPLSARHHRWEVVLEPGDDGHAIDPPVGREVRRATYVHHARRAARWRDGRVLLLGDAAHVMPPFAGQGLSHGLRDAADVAWKLAAVLRGDAAPALLDSYERERAPAVVAATRLALAWGALVGLRRPRAARARDALVSAPALVALARRPPRPRGGEPFPAPIGDVPAWALIARREDPRPAMPARDRALWDGLGARVVVSDHGHRDADVIAVRPDGFVLATARKGEEHKLADACRQILGEPEKGQGAGRRVARRPAKFHP